VTSTFCSASERLRNRTRFVAAIPCGNANEKHKKRRVHAPGRNRSDPQHLGRVHRHFVTLNFHGTHASPRPRILSPPCQTEQRARIVQG